MWQSFHDEVKRRNDKATLFGSMGFGGAKGEEVSEAMRLAQEELRRIEERTQKRKATSNDAAKRKSTSKGNRVSNAAPYQNVKSRLFKSIESTRQKETQKYENPNKIKFLEYRDKDQSQKSQNAS